MLAIKVFSILDYLLQNPLTFTVVSPILELQDTAMSECKERRTIMDNPTPITINGYNTFFVEDVDDIGKHLLICIPPNAGKDISEITNTFVNGHLIQQIDYKKVNDKVKYIKAYY